MTAYGEKILDIINNSTTHPTADNIFYQMRQNGEKVSLATVYNNLAKLANDGKIKKISFDGKVERFDKTIRHDHKVCTRCGKVEDVSFIDITKELKERIGDDVCSYELKIDYICNECKGEINE